MEPPETFVVDRSVPDVQLIEVSLFRSANRSRVPALIDYQVRALPIYNTSQLLVVHLLPMISGK